jgi:hypothetical protein
MSAGRYTGTIVERLSRVKPGNGASHAMARDALKEILRLSESTLKHERDEALAERTSLLDRIASQKRVIAELEATLNRARAA